MEKIMKLKLLIIQAYFAGRGLVYHGHRGAAVLRFQPKSIAPGVDPGFYIGIAHNRNFDKFNAPLKRLI